MAGIKVGLIGGSGLGEAIRASAGVADARRHAVETPFGPPSGEILETEWHGLPVFVLPRHGTGHLLSPSQVPYRANIFALKQLGVTHVIASGAVGSLREEFRPRDLVIPRPDHRQDHAPTGHVSFSPFFSSLFSILLSPSFRTPPAAA
jgi:5'-methylthioadenosine phosphorylase